MKKTLALVLVFAMVFALCACGSSQTEASSDGTSPATEEENIGGEVTTIKLATGFAATHPVAIALEEVADYVEEESGGTVKLDIYVAGALGSNSEIAQQMISGEIDAVIAGACDNFASYNPLLYVEDLPFLFEDYDAAHAAYDGAYGQALAELIDGIGCHTVSFWENGFRQMTNNVRPVTSPEDMAGLKMRSANASIFIKIFECLGATVTMVDMTELFSAMQQGMVDGQENPLTTILTSSYYEVQKYCTLTNHIYLSCPVVFNEALWEDYGEDIQNLLTEAFAMGCENERELNRQTDEAAVEELTAKGMEVDEVSDYEEWKTALAPVWDYFKSEYGAEGEALIETVTAG